MNTPGRSGSPLVILLVLLTISVLLDRYLIALFFPLESFLGGFSLMVVFLDIPVSFPMIDFIPVALLFSLFYCILVAANPGRYGLMIRQEIRKRLGGLFTGVFILLAWLMAGGLLFYTIEGYLPKQVRNGIDSFGLRMDLTDPYPGHERIHLHGSMIMLVCFIIGCWPLVRRARAALLPVQVIKQKETQYVRPVVADKAPAVLSPRSEPMRPRTVPMSVAIVAPSTVARVPMPEPHSSMLTTS